MDIKLPIGNNLRTDGPAAGGKPRGSPLQADQTPVTPKEAVGESVTLTDTAKTLSSVRGGAQEVPIDKARVAEIKSAIAEGRYAIDDQRLAKSILAFEGVFA